MDFLSSFGVDRFIDDVSRVPPPSAWYPTLRDGRSEFRVWKEYLRIGGMQHLGPKAS